MASFSQGTTHTKGLHLSTRGKFLTPRTKEYMKAYLYTCEVPHYLDSEPKRHHQDASPLR